MSETNPRLNPASRVEHLHATLIPPAIAALIRQRGQLMAQLKIDPRLELRRLDLAATIPKGATIGDVWSAMLELEDPIALIVAHAGLTVLIARLRAGEEIPLPADDVELLRLAAAQLR